MPSDEIMLSVRLALTMSAELGNKKALAIVDSIENIKRELNAIADDEKRKKICEEIVEYLLK